MPTISFFFGITIRMYFNDHAPPHFHARYGEHEATVVIDTLNILDGELPARALGLVREWAEIHKDELHQDWERCRMKQQPFKITPLE